MIPTLKLEFMPGAGPFDMAGDFYLNVTGAASSNATTPDAVALGITDDMEVRIDATLVSWASPPASGMELFGQFTPPSNQQWLVWVDPNRRLVLRHSTDGTAIIDNQCPVPLPVTSGRLAISIIIDVNNGVGGHTVFFRTAPTINDTFTLLGSKTTAGTTSIHNSTAVLGVGDVPSSGFSRPAGRFHAAQVIAGSAGTDFRANPDFTAQAPGTTSFADAAGRTWTVNSPASIAGFDWVDITDRLLGSTLNEGREDDLTTFGPGDQTVGLRNDDRAFDPKHSTGPYFGKLNPRTPFRFRMSDDEGVTWHDRFYGFARGGFRQTYFRGNTWATCTVALEDMLAVIGNSRLPGSAYEAVVLADQPAAYWRQDETFGTQMADSSGNGRHGAYDNGVLGQDGLVEGSVAAVEYPHVGDNRGQWSGEGLPVTSPASLEAWVKTTRDAAAIKSIIIVQRDSSLGSALALQIHTSVSGSPNGELVIDWFGLGTFYKARGHTRIDDNEPHHVMCTIAGLTPADVLLYVDGVGQTKTTVSGTNPGTWPSHLIWTVGNTTDTGQGDYGFDGVVDEAAVYNYVLTAEQINEHHQAGATAFDGDTTSERIDRVLDLIGLPDAFRDIATGDTTLGPADYNGSQVSAYLNRIVESEQGYLYVNHRDGGKVTFRGRYHRLTSSRSTTSQATFSQGGTPVPGAYKFADIHPAPNSIDSIVNEVEISWRGGTEIVTDADSVDAYGPQGRTLATEAPTPQAARSAGAWMTTRYGQPQSRVRGLVLNPGGDPEVWPAVLDLEVGDRITVNHTPQDVGSAITEQLIVEGIKSEIRTGLQWGMTYSLSDADDVQAWIWGTSTWGETTVWG